MQALIYEYLFLILLILGGVIVSIRSTELYGVPAPGNDAQWLNDQIHLRHLTGLRQYATGFLFYLIPVLLVYLMLSVSPELLKVSMGIAGTSSSVGALPITGSDVYTFAPLLAATAIITLLNVKPFSAVEQHLRRMAHGIAGIPQHIQDIIQQIRQVDFQTIATDSPLRGIALNNSQPVPGLDSDLATIDTLNDWIFGATAALIWSDKANHALQLSSRRITENYEAMRRKLLFISPAQGDTAHFTSTVADVALENVVKQTGDLRLQFTRLLAILIANQDRAISVRTTPQPLLNLVLEAQTRRASSHHFNTLVTSTITGIAISVPIAVLYNFLLILSHGLSTAGASLNIHDDTLLIEGSTPDEFYRASFIHATSAACWDVIGISLIFFAACAIALNYRAARVNTACWHLWHSRNHPVVQYIAVGILATAGAALFYEVFLLFKLVVWPSMQLSGTGHFESMLSDFGRYYIQFGIFACLAIPCSIMVCRLCDKMGTPSDYPGVWQDSQVRFLGLAVGVTGMLIFVFLRLQLEGSREFTTVIASAMVPSFTLFVMTALFWRIGEARPPDILLLPHGSRGKYQNEPVRGRNPELEQTHR